MPGFALTQTATVMCTHGGLAQPTAPLPRVMLSGAPAIGQAAPYTVAGCPFNVGGSPSPCVTATWTTAATRVRAGGIPLVLQDSMAVAVPNGTGLTIAQPGQARVSAT